MVSSVGSRKFLLHSAGDASRPAVLHPSTHTTRAGGPALLVGQILPVFFLLAPCGPGASPPSMLTTLLGRDTSGGDLRPAKGEVARRGAATDKARPRRAQRTTVIAQPTPMLRAACAPYGLVEQRAVGHSNRQLDLPAPRRFIPPFGRTARLRSVRTDCI